MFRGPLTTNKNSKRLPRRAPACRLCMLVFATHCFFLLRITVCCVLPSSFTAQHSTAEEFRHVKQMEVDRIRFHRLLCNSSAYKLITERVAASRRVCAVLFQQPRHPTTAFATLSDLCPLPRPESAACTGATPCGGAGGPAGGSR